MDKPSYDTPNSCNPCTADTEKPFPVAAPMPPTSYLATHSPSQMPPHLTYPCQLALSVPPPSQALTQPALGSPPNPPISPHTFYPTTTRLTCPAPHIPPHTSPPHAFPPTHPHSHIPIRSSRLTCPTSCISNIAPIHGSHPIVRALSHLAPQAFLMRTPRGPHTSSPQAASPIPYNAPCMLPRVCHLERAPKTLYPYTFTTNKSALERARTLVSVQTVLPESHLP